MSKLSIPLFVEDISAFTRSLAQQLNNDEEPASHLKLMNMLARAAGFRNFQHLRAAHRAGERLAHSHVAENVDHRLVERALNQFDSVGRLRQWPSRRSVQELSLWALWARLPVGTSQNEREVSALLCAEHLFEDPALLRRSMISQRLVSRNRDGTDYRRRELRPPVEARVLIGYLETRRGTRGHTLFPTSSASQSDVRTRT